MVLVSGPHKPQLNDPTVYIMLVSIVHVIPYLCGGLTVHAMLCKSAMVQAVRRHCVLNVRLSMVIKLETI